LQTRLLLLSPLRCVVGCVCRGPGCSPGRVVYQIIGMHRQACILWCLARNGRHSVSQAPTEGMLVYARQCMHDSWLHVMQGAALQTCGEPCLHSCSSM
jgi:hypothetical protein